MAWSSAWPHLLASPPCPLLLQALSLGSLTTQLIATGGSDAVIRLWCSLTGRLLQQLRGHSDRVTRLAWSPCGSLLASASLDGTVRMWQLQGCAEPPAEGGQNGPGSRGGELGLMSPAEGPVVSSQGGRPSCLAFSPDSALLAVGTSEGTVWLVGTGTAAACADDGSSEGASDSAPAALWRCQKLSGHGALVSAVSFSPCGRLLASASGAHMLVVCMHSGLPLLLLAILLLLLAILLLRLPRLLLLLRLPPLPAPISK